VVEQDVEFLLNLADRLYLIEGGKVVLERDAEHPDTLEHEQIMQMYFGGSDRSALAHVMEDDR
jgi:ABC-type branched-subunit amino acid transport system ATPase component